MIDPLPDLWPLAKLPAGASLTELRLSELIREIEWCRQVDAVPGDILSPTHKLVLRYLYPIFRANGNQLQLVYLEGMASHIGISAGTMGKAARVLEECSMLVRNEYRDPLTRHRRLQLGPGPRFFAPSTITVVAPRNHGGVRVPACPDCPPDTEVIEQRTVRTKYVCKGCGNVLHDGTDEHRHILSPTEEEPEPPTIKPHLAPIVYTNKEIVLPQVAGRSPVWQELNPAGVPEGLRSLDQWMVYRLEERAPGEYNKAPRNARTGCIADKTDPSQWCTYEEAVSAAKSGRFDGIGVVLMAHNGITGIDLDKCRDPESGELSRGAANILDRLDTYRETSPSGKGARAFVFGRLPAGRRKKGGVEMYDAGAFLTVTGQRLPGSCVDLEQRQDELQALHAELIGGTVGRPSTAPRSLSPSVPVSEVVQRASSARNGEKFAKLYQGIWQSYASQSEADLALCGMLAYWTGQDADAVDELFRGSGLYRDKWDRPCKDGRTYGEVTVMKAISGEGGL